MARTCPKELFFSEKTPTPSLSGEGQSLGVYGFGESLLGRQRYIHLDIKLRFLTDINENENSGYWEESITLNVVHIVKTNMEKRTDFIHNPFTA